MSTTPDDRPLVDADIQERLSGAVQRILEHATPDSWVAGGSHDSQDLFTTETRTQEALKNREQIYRNGGPIAAMIDTRALMTYGTGVEFDTEDTAITDDQGRTVADWLTEQMGDWIDLHMIDAGIQAYWAGDAWPEIVETRGGDFSHVDLVDPTTVDVSWDEHGEFTTLRQVIEGARGQPREQRLDEDLIGHYTFRNSTGGPLGDSLVEQNKDEIERFARNQEQRANAIRLHGSPKYDVSVGSEDQSIPDRLMRLIRNKFKSTNVDEKTSWVHGGQIEIETLDSPGFEGMGTITETDIAMLASSFRVPLEWLNFGSDGLGSGAPAKSRLVAFERQARAEQTRRSQQFLEEIARPVLERYSPFPREVDVQIEFGDVVSDQAATAEWMGQFPWAFHRDEVRERLDVQPWDDDANDDREAPPEVAPSTAGPAGGSDGDGMPGGGLFTDADGDDTPESGRGTGNDRALLHDSVSESDLTREELVWRDVIEEALWSDDTSRELFEFDPEEVPEFVTERLQEAIEDSLFSEFETVPDHARTQVKEAMLDSLERQHGWSIDSIAGNLQDAVSGLSRMEAERIARSETQALVTQAREEGYRDQFDLEEERFYWTGPMDHRKTDGCEWLVEETNPHHGGSPVALEELRDLVEEANARDPEIDHEPREWSVHIQCRDTFVRHVE